MIRWNTDVNAPCCPGEIVNEETGQTILVQTDWEYPSVASSFGWWIGSMQVCHKCGHSLDVSDDDTCTDCPECGESQILCRHEGTDGTVQCDQCKLTASDFILAAEEWLDKNDGATADDPGYF